MSVSGTSERPLCVAIVGSGPAGFYTAEHLFRRDDLTVRVDMFERLPMPFGLVRYGVAPDHQKIKKATKAFDRVASRPEFRFFGNVEYGRHVTLDDLRRHYHAVCFATGAQTDRSMGIPGEELDRSHPATEFVAWYNGHPDYRDHTFDLSVECAAVVGVGNVAVDVARVLCRTPEELEKTDIADYALETLRASRIKEVYMLGRRGPAQAAFTNAEVKELGELEGADLIVRRSDLELDTLSESELAKGDDRAAQKKVEILRALAARAPQGRARQLKLRFLVSPVELTADSDGRVAGMRLVRNVLYRAEDGALRPKPSDEHENLPVKLVFRSVGYRGVALPQLPFEERRGVIPSDQGRVVDPENGRPVPGLYVTGWIKRGPSGIIGTNKPDAGETVASMAGDAAEGLVPEPAVVDADAIERLVRERQPDVVGFDDWQRLDAFEMERGAASGRPRVKLTSLAEALAQLRGS
jgi:ferredoxin--NADP+ reductase